MLHNIIYLFILYFYSLKVELAELYKDLARNRVFFSIILGYRLSKKYQLVKLYKIFNLGSCRAHFLNKLLGKIL
jgi:hypothetical protein